MPVVIQEMNGVKLRDNMAGKDDDKEAYKEETGGYGPVKRKNRSRRTGSYGKTREGSGEIDCWRRYVENAEVDGVKQEIISESDLSKRKVKRWYLGNDSFMLEDGRYAYRDCNYDVKNKPVFYRVLTIEDDEAARFISGMHAIDQEEGKSYRTYCLHQDYGYENFKLAQEAGDGDDEWMDPIDKEAFSERTEDTDKSRPFPLRPEYAVIRAVIKQMTPADREVYEMLFDSFYTEAEIKAVLGLEDSAWTNRKNRFMDRMKRIFVRLGYDVDLKTGYESPADDEEDVMDLPIKDMEEGGDFGDIEDADDTGYTDGLEYKEKCANKDGRIVDDFWRNEIRNDMRHENRRDRWM